MAATRINKGVCPFDMACSLFVVVSLHFHVARQNVEEILQHLRKLTFQAFRPHLILC